jgi:hypothetical protein
MRAEQKFGLHKLQSMFTEVFGLGRAAALSAVISILVVLVLGIFLFFYLAPPNTITITSGPEGSTFRRTAGRYAKILQRNGVTLKILPSEGSVDNIKRLADPSSKVDIGFVQGGVSKEINTDKLVSLGSISYQPLFVFYRSGSNIELLSQLIGKQVAVGEVGSKQGKGMGDPIPHDMYYDEFIGGSWQRIVIDGEMLMGRAHHVIYFDSPGKWRTYPEWARNRRDEIIGRIKSEFTEPDYEYDGA